MGLASLTRPGLIFPDLPGADPPTVLRALAERVTAAGVVEAEDELYRRLWEREQLGSTGIGRGVAIPHCKIASLDRVTLAVGIARREVDFGAVDDVPVRIFFLLVSPQDEPAEHLRSLAAISEWLKGDPPLERMVEADDPEEILALLDGKGDEP